MGAYAYCSKCNLGMSAPTPEEILDSKKDCANCGKSHFLGDYEKKDLFLNLIERIENLEKMNHRLESVNKQLEAINKQLINLGNRTSGLIRIGG